MAGQLGHKTLRPLFIETPVNVFLQFWRRYRPTPIAVSVPEGMNTVHRTEQTLVNHGHRLDIARVEEALLTREEDFAGLKMFVIHLFALCHRVADGLFAEYMLTCIIRIEYDLAVCEQRRCHHYRVDALVIKQLVIIFIRLGFRHHLESLVQGRLIHVGEGNHVDFRILKQEAE